MKLYKNEKKIVFKIICSVHTNVDYRYAICASTHNMHVTFALNVVRLLLIKGAQILQKYDIKLNNS